MLAPQPDAWWETRLWGDTRFDAAVETSLLDSFASCNARDKYPESQHQVWMVAENFLGRLDGQLNKFHIRMLHPSTSCLSSQWAQ